MKSALILLLLLWSSAAAAPVPQWRLEPIGFKPVNLCLKPCELTAYHVTGYHYVAD